MITKLHAREEEQGAQESQEEVNLQPAVEVDADLVLAPSPVEDYQMARLFVFMKAMQFSNHMTLHSAD